MAKITDLSKNAQTLLSKSSSDEAFREKFNACDSKEAVLALCKESSLSITMDELQELEDVKDDLELAEDDLDEVAGGGCGVNLSGCKLDLSSW